MIVKVFGFVAISLVIMVLIAVGLILSQWPRAINGSEGLDFTNTLTTGGEDPQPLEQTVMRDGYGLQLRSYPSGEKDAPLVILVHGSGWHGLQFDRLAKALSAIADVLVPDLRGHGVKPGVRGDIAYLGQFEDDLSDLIAAHRKPGQKLVLAGHSSGGGLVVRYAGGGHGMPLDGAVLLAPFLQHNAPTTRTNSGGWAHVMTRRIIGLSMLNTLRIRALNFVSIIQFNMPKVVLDGPLGETATTSYSYRLNTSFAPRNYQKDVPALPRFALIVGSADDAFFADQYQPVMAPLNDKGRYLIVEGVNHLDIVNAPETLNAMKEFLDEF